MRQEHEASVREVNEQIRRVHDVLGQDGSDEAVVCECGNAVCEKEPTLSRAEYEAVRAHTRRFLIALDYENPEVERVVDQNGTVAVVETFVGEPSRIAEETDPRRLSGVN
jgi:hypothetical protein